MFLRLNRYVWPKTFMVDGISSTYEIRCSILFIYDCKLFCSYDIVMLCKRFDFRVMTISLISVSWRFPFVSVSLWFALISVSVSWRFYMIFVSFRFSFAFVWGQFSLIYGSCLWFVFICVSWGFLWFAYHDCFIWFVYYDCFIWFVYHDGFLWFANHDCFRWFQSKNWFYNTYLWPFCFVEGTKRGLKPIWFIYIVEELFILDLFLNSVSASWFKLDIYFNSSW